MKFLRAMGASILRVFSMLVRLPEWLNWLLAVVEPLVVLGVTFSLAYATYWLVFAQDKGHAYLSTTIKQLNDNWKVGLILLVALFYRTIRIFLEQAEEAWGVKRKRLQGQELNPSSLEPRQDNR
jgi:hypothetical protein